MHQQIFPIINQREQKINKIDNVFQSEVINAEDKQ